MATCSVRWRASGGRGEFEFVPADSLVGRHVFIDFGPLNAVFPAEVRGVIDERQRKPRLRKLDSNNRKKFHLPQLIMAVAGLPEPAREDLAHAVQFPLENKQFVINSMDFDIIADDGHQILLKPLRVSIMNTDFSIKIDDRLSALACDQGNIRFLRERHPDLSKAVSAHFKLIEAQVNDRRLRETADEMIKIKSELFGMTNAASAFVLTHTNELPATDLEDITGKEGRLLIRIHAYRERDRKFATSVKLYYKKLFGGQLHCEACGMIATRIYGNDGEQCIEVHHKIPVEQLQPDSIMTIEEMAVLCASCHRIVHTQKPCLTISELERRLIKQGYLTEVQRGRFHHA